MDPWLRRRPSDSRPRNAPRCGSAHKFKARHATLGFSDKANLDKGALWPTAFALKELTAAGEKKIVALVKKAVS